MTLKPLSSAGQPVTGTFTAPLTVADESGVVFQVATGGNVILAALPTSDPAVAGALFSTLGVVHVSAG